MSETVFKRKIYKKMLAWKQERAGSTALLIKGARRVGKSTVAEEFAKKEYKTYIAIDFAKADSEIHSLFDNMMNLDFFFLRLQAIFNVELFEKESVIIFDEVQLCPKARQAIKFLVADGRYDYIETGSLMSLRKFKAGIIIPSEETRITMHPLDFEEFLEALGDKQTMSVVRYAYENLVPLGDALHRKVMRQFRLYMLVGGMPQAINRYLDTNNMAQVDAVKREILELYIDDLREIDVTGRASRIFQSVPSELSKGKLRYQVGSVIDNASSLNMDGIWQDLENSLTINMSYRCTDPNVGMSLHKDYNYFKVYLEDTGLFVTLAFLDYNVANNSIYEKLLSDKLSADLGYVYENIVAQSLTAAGHNLFYYTFKADPEGKNHYEIDFLISDGTKIAPIEVKSSSYTAHKSLDVFITKYSPRIGRKIILYTKDLRTDSNLIYLPVYMAGLL